MYEVRQFRRWFYRWNLRLIYFETILNPFIEQGEMS